MDTTFDSTVKQRLVDLIEARGLSINSIERDLGRGRNWLRRKLRDERPLMLADIDEVLGLLEVPIDTILKPTNTRKKKGKA